MVTQEAVRSNYETRQSHTEAYARLGLPNGASLSEVVKAVGYYEDSRRFLVSSTNPTEQVQTDLLYKTSVLHSIHNEMARCISSGVDENEALTMFSSSVRTTNDLAVGDSLLQDLDEHLFDFAIDVVSDGGATPLEKGIATVLSLGFAAKQRGVNKTEMILARRLVSEQAAKLTHLNRESQAKALEDLDAVKNFFDFAGLEYHSELIDSRLSVSAHRAAESAQAQLEKARQALENGSQAGRRAAAVGVLASMSIGAGANLAAADTGAGVESGKTGGDSAVVMASISNEAQAALETPIAAVVAVDSVDIKMAQIGTQTTSMEPTSVTVVESIGDGEVVMSSINAATAPVKDLGPITVEMTEIDEEAEPAPAVSIEAHSEGDGHDHGEEVAPAVPSAVESTEPEVNEEGVVEPSKPISLVAPNNDVNVAVGETPQEAITRIVASRDMKAASFAIRQNFGGIDVVNQPAVNEALKALIAADIEELRAKIPEAAHADAAYTDKAFFALAYLDAVAQTPSLLDNPEVAAFVASITDQGEAYRNKLFATYLAEAKAALSAENAGAYANVAEQYRAPIETLYAYVAMAAMNDEVQAHQIQEIKDEEARIAAEEEAKRKAAELAAQGLGEIEAIAADEKRLVLTAIDRAEQQGLITARYAAVYRTVIDLEGPGARVAAAGLVGNCMAEAAGCDPLIVERGNGIGFGIFQWSFGRRTTLENTAGAQGIDVGDLGFQVRYAIAESKARTGRDDKSLNEWAGMMSQTDPGAAAEFWRWNFERPKDHLASTNTRIQVANEVFAHVNGQIDAIRSEAAAAKAERERIAAEQAAEAERQRALVAEGDMRPVLADGLSIRAQLEAKYGESGRLDNSDLREIESFSKDGSPKKIYLNPAAVDSFNALDAAFRANFGEPIRITDHYRDYNEQVDVKQRKGNLAARPGTSNHGWGMAIDFASNINTEGSPQHEWMEQNAHKYGWVNPSWAHDGTPKGGAEEPWHWEFEGNQATFEKTNN